MVDFFTMKHGASMGDSWVYDGIAWIYPLVMTKIAMVCRWPIEIDDFPS